MRSWFECLWRRSRRAWACLGLVCLLLILGCQPDERPEVVVYTSQDQVYAQEIFDAFTAETGVRVAPLFDSESVKTAGLVNRLVAERARPRCDVFWSNEEMMLRRLGEQGVLESDALVTFGFRSRRLIVNTNLVAVEERPDSLEALTQPKWRGRVVVAYPLFGTTATHMMALRASWGAERWERWCRGLVENECLMVDGNSAVVRLVGSGEVSLGLTDSDDLRVGQRNGLPLAALPLDEWMSLIANSAAPVVGRPHPRTADQFLTYLQTPAPQALLVDRGALEGLDTSGLPHLEADWSLVMGQYEAAYAWLDQTFLR